MAVKTLTNAEMTALLAQTVGTLTRDDLRNLEDALNKKYSTPSQAINTVLP